MADTKTYHGSWWIPTGDTVTEANPCTGTLTIDENNACRLSIDGVPRMGDNFSSISVFWGRDRRDQIITLFGAELTRWDAPDHEEYLVRYAIIGQHITSLDESFFDECYAEFPYLQNWTEASLITIPKEIDKQSFAINHGGSKVYVQGEMDEGIKYKVVDDTWYSTNRLNFLVWKKTQYQLISDKQLSIRAFNDYLREFSQFLSLSLFSKQSPSTIYFKRKDEEETYQLYFVASPSTKPFDYALISIGELKDRMPLFISNYHTVYDKISTLARYLLTSLNENDFDAPDFLIVAHALDGYFKRFLNKTSATNGKDRRKGEDGYKTLVNRFEDIKAVQKCAIDTEVLIESRDFYSHLLPDGEKPKAAKGNDLIILTQKCKVLLTCCILEQMGMTHKEIGDCIDRSVLQFTVYNVKRYEERKQKK